MVEEGTPEELEKEEMKDWIIWMLEELDRRISALESDSEGRGSDSEGFQRLLQGLKEELKTSK